MQPGRPPSHPVKDSSTPPPAKYSIFVSKLPTTGTDADVVEGLVKCFGKYGEVYAVDLSDSKTYGFVRFFTKDAAMRALHVEMPTVHVNGKAHVIKVTGTFEHSPDVLHIGGFTREQRELSCADLQSLVQGWCGETIDKIDVPTTEEGTNK
eukprot:Sspe_Gene.14969::Locus_5188_Transcript_1_1_Confidence_1.000_Length_645::g.14969::m.14969